MQVNLSEQRTHDSPVTGAAPGAGSVGYLGSKTRLLETLGEHIGQPLSGGHFVDLFSGTGVVGGLASRMGWKVLANDTLSCANALSSAALASTRSASFDSLGGYEAAVDSLNEADREGFIFREYSPEGAPASGDARLYFTPGNATRIDGARALIDEWSREGLLNQVEERLLIADLLVATTQVSNTAGTYGAFLKSFSARALSQLKVTCRDLPDQLPDFRITRRDAREVEVPEGSLVYIDPPYTKRQYAAYYHILETVAEGDSPEVEGVTGLRPWQEKTSPFCFKARAGAELAALAGSLAGRASRLLISYSTDGHADLFEVAERLEGWDAVTVHTLDQVPRYRPNEKARRGQPLVTELLLEARTV